MSPIAPDTGPAAEPIAEAELRQALTIGYRRLGQLGLNSGSAGNLSCRFADGALISPTGADADDIEESAFVAIALSGETRSPGRPSSEWSMHAEIYRRYPQATAIVHTHSDACVALSCQRRSIPAFHYMLAGFGGDDVRCAPYRTFGTEALAQVAADALDGRSACLLANHGMICHGPSVDRAIASAARLETLARQYWMTCLIGPPVLLGADEMATVRERYKTYGRNPPIA